MNAFADGVPVDLYDQDNQERLASRRVVPESASAPGTRKNVIAKVARCIDADWLVASPPARRWLLEQDNPEDEGASTRGWLPRGKVGMLAAGGGVGKTMALVSLAISVATGRKWFGLTVGSTGRVLLALAEEDLEEVQRRIFHAAHRLRLTEAERERVVELIVIAPLAGTMVALLERDGAGNVLTSALHADLVQVLNAAEDWALVVLDPLARWAGIDGENDNALATRFVETVETLVRAPGAPTVLVAHHTSKAARREGDSTASAARGASALTDGMRWVATMVPGTIGKLRTVRIEVAKSNYSHPGDPIDLVREDNGALSLLPKEAMRAEVERDRGEKERKLDARVLEAIGKGQFTSADDLRSIVQCGKSPLSAAIARLKASGRLSKASKADPFVVVS